MKSVWPTKRLIIMSQEKGIRTPEQARKDHENRKTTGQKKNEKVLPAQDFAQRDYSGVQEEMMQTLAREMEAFKHGNGGKSDA